MSVDTLTATAPPRHGSRQADEEDPRGLAIDAVNQVETRPGPHVQDSLVLVNPLRERLEDAEAVARPAVDGESGGLVHGEESTAVEQDGPGIELRDRPLVRGHVTDRSRGRR